ncbi:V-type proton ATPase subunit E-like [Phragmites australis]|uniref:V-type proton ATPase subunit E-like n=1 Tax=Phragmites australis TaxID=29695 RepID=UPI002D79B86D|nr:V-type proton ATPase subunit E-like [Phragmites australis]
MEKNKKEKSQGPRYKTSPPRDGRVRIATRSPASPRLERSKPIAAATHRPGDHRRTSSRRAQGPLPAAKMDDVDVSRQLKQMTDFIRQEAVEKAAEIEAAAAEEFQIEKLQLVEAEKKKMRQEYDRKEKQVGIKKKIDYSMQLNASRIKVLQAQDDLVTNMMEATRKELLYISRDHQTYKKLLRILIVQSLLRLKEPAVVLRCRKEDLELVDSVLESARNEYAEKTNVYPPEIVVDRHVYLPSAPSHYEAHGLSCSGGVVLASRDGKIVCENTLDARLQVVFRKKLPEIRRSLFGQVAA